MERSGLQFGAAYDIEEASPQKLREDFETMAQAGMNLVRLGADRFDREGLERLHQAAQICRELGLHVYLVLPDTGEFPEKLLDFPVDGFQISNSTPPQGLEHKDLVVMTRLESREDPFGAAGKYTLGCGIFHEAGLKNTGSELNFQGDLARAAAGDNYLVLETQSQGGLGRLPFPGQLRLSAFHHLASGARGLCYWPWNSQCAPGSDCQGVIGYDGQPGRAYREISQIGREFARLEPHLAGLSKSSRIAVLVSPCSARLMPKSCHRPI